MNEQKEIIENISVEEKPISALKDLKGEEQTNFTN